MSKKKGKRNNNPRPKACSGDTQTDLVDYTEGCCIPVGIPCLTPNAPLSDDPEAGKMVCSSDRCLWHDQPGHIHAKCFEKLEEKGVVFLRSSKGRAREWSDKERLRYLWQDRAYELIFRMFPCPCGQGFLRKYNEVELVDGAVGGIDVKKKKKGLPKLNVAPSMLSQKGVGQYFADPNCKQNAMAPAVTNPSKKMRKISESKALLDKRDQGRSMVDSEPTQSKRPCQIPGLMLEGPSKPQTLNIDLKSLEQPPPMPPLRPHQPPKPLMSSLERDLDNVVGNLITRDQVRRPSYLQKCADPPDNELFESDSEDENVEEMARDSPDLSGDRGFSSPTNYNRAYRHYRHPTELENVELLQQNISLRQENVALKQSIALDRKTFSAAIEGYSDEIQRKNLELWQLYEMMKKEENVKSLLREAILMETNPKKLIDSESQTDTANGERSFQELGLFVEVSQKLEGLKASAKSLSTSQNMAEGRMLQLDYEVKQLREENMKFRAYVEKFRSYFMLYDQFDIY